MKNNKLSITVQVMTSVAMLCLSGQASALKIVGNANDSSDLAEFEFEIYGYARLNASYDIDEDISSGARTGNFSLINTGAAEDNEVVGFFGADAYQTRFGILTTHSSGLTIKVEADFETNGNGLRLRHAYGEYMGILAGQNWSNFTSFVGSTPVLDFDALPGSAGAQFRTPQVRYTVGPFSISAEEPLSYNGLIESNGPPDPVDGTRSVRDNEDEKDSLPVFAARFEDTAGSVSYSAAAMVRQVDYDNGTTDDSAVGYGAFGAVSLALTDTFTLHGAINYVKGGGVYLYRSGENFAAVDGYVTENGDLELIGGYGGTVGVSVDVGPGSFNVGYGFTEVDWDDGEKDLGADAVADRHENNSSILANYQWNPIEQVVFGIEYGYFKVKEVGGDEGDANRLLFAAQYNF